MQERFVPPPTTPGGPKEKKSSKNEDPLKKNIEDYTLRVQGMREGLKLRREALMGESAQEAEEEREHTDNEALRDTIDFLQTEATEADAAGDTEKRDKLIEAKRALQEKVEKSVEEQMDEKDRADTEANLKDSDKRIYALRKQLKEQEFEEEAMPLLKKLATKDTENFDYTVSTEKLSQAVADAAGDRERVIEAKIPEQHKNFMRSLAERYRAMPRWKKYLIGGALLAGGVASTIIGGPTAAITWGLWTAQRGMSGFGAYVIADAATERWKNRYVAGIVSGGVGVAAAFAVPSFVHYLDTNYLHIGDYIRDYLGFQKPGVPLPPERPAGIGNPLFDPNPTPGAPAFEYAPGVGAGIEHLFDQPIVVTADDRAAGLWGILQDKLTDANIINDSTPQTTINKMISALENHLRALGPEKLRDLGFVSGRIGTIHAGESLDLSILDKAGWIKQLKLFR